FHKQIVQGHGEVESIEVKYGKLGIQLPFGLKTRKLEVDINTSGTNQQVRITAESVNSQLKGVPSGAFNILARKVSLTSANPDKPLLSNQYKIRNIDVEFVEYETYVSVMDPDHSMRRVYKDLNQLLDRGDTTGRLRMEGTVYFDFGKDGVIPQRFTTRPDRTLTRIVLNRKDLDQIAPKFASRLSTGDLDLVADHPLKAPRLLEIRRETEEKARELRWAQKNFPEDVYRHVLWSYLLTKEYGSEFAETVTNAHETGSYNTEEEMAKDRQNNRIGIYYALNDVPEAKILSRIQSDPRIHY
ncbi:MAG: hypothetical protein KJT03_08020, partial [Verrucomicrobiae bacterium]|nr:hypothetical protein [Verrucomicrobiae bacterium]